MARYYQIYFDNTNRCFFNLSGILYVNFDFSLSEFFVFNGCIVMNKKV